MADFMRNGIRTRKTFDKLADAQLWCQVKAVELKNAGTSALTINDALRVEVAAAVKKLDGRATITEAVDFWISKHPAGSLESWDETAQRYLAAMREGGRRDVSLVDKQHKFDTLSEALGNAPTLTLDKGDIEAAVRTLAAARGWAPLNADKNIGAGLTLLRFFRGEGRRMHRQDEAPPATWSADQIRVMMHKAESVAPGSVAALAVMTFAGIRPAEAMRLTWDMVDIERHTISLMGDVTKTRTTRHVDIPTNLRQWLTRYKGEGQLVRSAGGFRGDREKIMQAAGITAWPNDVLRHTAATMMYAQSGDVNHVCQQLGHVGGANVFLKHYRGLAPKPAEVQAFWRIVNQA
jgi:integrase